MFLGDNLRVFSDAFDKFLDIIQEQQNRVEQLAKVADDREHRIRVLERRVTVLEQAWIEFKNK